MPEMKQISIGSLGLDVDNPRLPGKQLGQIEAMRAMLKAEGPKTLALAEHIASNGLSPAERLIVTEVKERPGTYVVLEGNRRITALKILETPAAADGAVSPGQLDRLKKWGAQFKEKKFGDKIDCAVFSSRDEADPWVDMRHLGEQDGVGIVKWGSIEQARREKQRTGTYAPELQVLDFVEQFGDLDEGTRAELHDIPITNIDRLLADKASRRTLGVDIDSSGNLTSTYPNEEVAKGLSRIVRELADGTLKVKKIYDAKAMRDYLSGFGKADLPDPAKAGGASRALLGGVSAGGPSRGSGAGPKKGKKSAGPRSKLIPTTCALEVTNAKIANVERELRRLSLEDYPNAVGVLFRVFVELSTDEILEREKKNLKTKIDERSKLRIKLETAAGHLESQGTLSTSAAKGVKKAANNKSLLCSSLETMHQYVHGRHVNPSPTDLRAGWDDLQPYLEAIWK